MIGVVQGRLTHSRKQLQSFPKDPFKEFYIARKVKYDFIEFFAERNINKDNPIWSNNGIKKYIKFARLNNIKIYSFIDEYFIKFIIKIILYFFYKTNLTQSFRIILTRQMVL